MCVRMSPRLEGLGRGGQGQAVPQGEDRCGPDSSQKGDAQRAGRLPSRAHRVTAFTNNKNSNTHRHQSGHSHSALDSEPPLLGTERGTGSRRMRYLCRPEGRLADTSFNSGPASGCREVNGAEERRFTSLTISWAPGLPFSLFFPL